VKEPGCVVDTTCPAERRGGLSINDNLRKLMANMSLAEIAANFQELQAMACANLPKVPEDDGCYPDTDTLEEIYVDGVLRTTARHPHMSWMCCQNLKAQGIDVDRISIKFRKV
jgi:hypothetical protein